LHARRLGEVSDVSRDLDDFSFPIPSGFRRLPDEEQERFRREHVMMMRKLAPVFAEMDRCRRQAEVESRTAFVG
jgi:hypothetical protein